MLGMSLTSLLFTGFFLLSLGIYYCVPGRIQWVALLIFSVCFFLLSSTPYTGIYLLITIISTWLCARIIYKALSQGKQKQAKAGLIAGIVVNLGMLVLLKYTDFLFGNFNRIFSLLYIAVRAESLGLLVPLGISFYTMQVMGYLLDVYWGIAVPPGNPLKTALFVGYYPLLTSGPITRWQQIGESLYQPHKFDSRTVSFGLQRMLWGVFKKLVISARIGILVDTIYGDTAAYPGFYIWLATGLFMMQLYTDFSGCMDIIIGASECYGIVLPENFRTPFFSRSVQEFWQRWHISLGGWLRDYLLYPILKTDTWNRLRIWTKTRFGKKASKQFPVWFGMLFVWLSVGLWHGGGWKYILGQGLWFWSCIVLGQALEPVFKRWIEVLKINTECFSWHLFQSLRVFVLVSIGNMFFRLKSIANTFQTIKAGITCWNPEIFFDQSLLQLGLDQKNLHVVNISLLLLLLVSVLEEREKTSVWELLEHQNLVFRWFVWFVLVFGIILLGMYGPGYDAQAFIYERF